MIEVRFLSGVPFHEPHVSGAFEMVLFSQETNRTAKPRFAIRGCAQEFIPSTPQEYTKYSSRGYHLFFNLLVKRKDTVITLIDTVFFIDLHGGTDDFV